MKVKDFLSSITDISWRNINLFIQDSEKTYFTLKMIEEDFEKSHTEKRFFEQEIVNFGFECDEEEGKADIIVYTK